MPDIISHLPNSLFMYVINIAMVVLQKMFKAIKKSIMEWIFIVDNCTRWYN